MNHQEIIDRITSTWTDFRNLIAAVPEDVALESVPPGAWNTRDIAGHVAWWERKAADEIAGLLSIPGNETLDERNAREHTRISQLTYAEAIALLDESHEHLMKIVREHPEVKQAQVEGDTWEHFQDHGTDIRNWLNTRTS
ncbi:MAG: DinB family protein [Thermomicrobiales bacterium]